MGVCACRDAGHRPCDWAPPSLLLLIPACVEVDAAGA